MITPANHFTNNLGLTDAASQDAYTSANSQDEEHLEEKHCKIKPTGSFWHGLKRAINCLTSLPPIQKLVEA
jgi:hypothetical protein